MNTQDVAMEMKVEVEEGERQMCEVQFKFSLIWHK